MCSCQWSQHESFKVPASTVGSNSPSSSVLPWPQFARCQASSPLSMSTMAASITPSPGIPVFLLKTRSSPGDSYEDLFSQASNDFSFETTFIPVLQHHFDEEGLALVRTALQRKDIGSAAGARYGGMIFTSQRAVEAFAKVIEDGLRGKRVLTHLFPHAQHPATGSHCCAY